MKVVSKHVEYGNLFERRTGKYGVVNAWDSNSYIGNGLLNDPTIDGWFVAGYGPNKKLKNSSFLHNPVLNIKALQEELGYTQSASIKF